MKTIFLRHGKLDLPYISHDEMPYEVIRDLGTGSLDPEVDPTFARERIDAISSTIDLSNITRIYASPSRRAKSTAALVAEKIGTLSSKTPEILVEPLLAEVAFDMDALGVKEEVMRLVSGSGMKALNELVFAGMISGSCESAQAAYERVGRFLAAHTDTGALCISHDFLLRVVELYILNSGSPIDMTTEVLRDTQRNGYLEGFVYEDGTITPIKS